MKKETVRIDVPAAPKPIPQATVKMQPAPAPSRPAVSEPVVRTSAPVSTIVPSTAIPADDREEPAREDSTMMLVSVGVLLFAVATFAIQLLTYLTP